jgi:hypothetical protein
VDRLLFGTTALRRARRRRRLRRAVLVAWAASVAGVVLGIPSPLSPGEVLRGLSGRAGSFVESTENSASVLRFRRQISNEPFEQRPLAPDPPGYKGSLASPSPPEQTGDHSAAPYGGDITAIIDEAAEEFGVNGDYLVAIAECESGLDPQALNPSGYYGLFQYDEQTWAVNGYGSIFDPAAQARTTARLISEGQTSRWPNCA